MGFPFGIETEESPMPQQSSLSLKRMGFPFGIETHNGGYLFGATTSSEEDGLPVWD